MGFRDLKIGTQLAIGLGLILLLVILLGAVVIIQEERLWDETQGMYEHPLQVRRAVGELKADILVMHRGMKDLFLTSNSSEQEQVLQGIATAETNAYRQFDILYDRYLGPQSDIDTAYKDFVAWNIIRAETLRLMREGEVAEAASRTRDTGPGGAQAGRLMQDVQVIDDFARAKGDEFYATAQEEKDLLMGQLVALLAAIILLTIGISIVMVKGIRDPVRELTGVTEQYRAGNLNARSGIVLGSEIGTLANSFDSLADTVQADMQGKENAAGIAGVMLREEDLSSFSRELLRELVERTGSQMGAVYLLDGTHTRYDCFESTGLSGNARQSFSAALREGEFGAALAARQVRRITDIPEETVFVFPTMCGEIRPREIITIPVLSGTTVVAVISLASIRPYTGEALRLVDDIWSMLTARFNGVLLFGQIRETSKILEHQNRELNEKSRELTAQADELREQNIELDLQKMQLDEANRAKTAFLSNMSHELRTPLNAVIALSGVLGRRLRGTIPDEEYGYLDVIQRNGRHLLALINDILDIARIESGREEISLRTFPVREISGTVVERIRPQAEEKGITLSDLVSPELPFITSDFAKCQHILENIVANAVKFTESGIVTVHAAVMDDMVQIRVTDTGIGISEDQARFIFDEFRQADETISRKYGGTGLGLSIARKYARLLSGDIKVESTPGKGSTFTLELPLAITLPTPPGSSAGEQLSSRQSKGAIPPTPASGRGKTILLVEDNEPAIIQVRELLDEAGYTVRVARNGKEALEEIQTAIPDAMVLDLMMPEVDGFTVLRMVRGDARTAGLPVLILTARHVTAEELSFLQGNQVYQLIQKGDISRADLLGAVARMVSGAKGPGRDKQVRREPDTRTQSSTPVHGGPGEHPVIPPGDAGRKPGQSPETSSPEQQESSRPAMVRDRPLILVIEDNPDNLLTVKTLLSEHYIPIGAADGRSGLALARSKHPDLILLDISLPVMDGFAVLAAIRADEALSHIPVIAVTARAMKGDREDILARGFDGYLAKPVDDQGLEEIIRRHLNE